MDTNNAPSNIVAMIKKNKKLLIGVGTALVAVLVTVLKAPASTTSTSSKAATTSNSTVSTSSSSNSTTSSGLSSGFDATTGLSLLNLGKKAQTIEPGATKNILSYTGSGVLKKLWLATYGMPPGLTFLKITIDGVLVFGNNLTTNIGTGLNTNGVSLDMLITPGGAHLAVYNTACIGCNNYLTGGGGANNEQLGGYIALDMPFSTSIVIALNNGANTAVITPFPYTYWVQPFILTSSVPRVFSPLALYCDTFRYNNTTALNEYPWMSVASKGNGVYLKGVKFYVIGNSGAWWEGRVRMYSGGTGMIVPQVGTGYTDNTFADSLPYQTGATVVFSSTGFEDLVLSSYNVVNQATAFGDSAGTLYKSTGILEAGTQWSAYRFFDVNGEGMPFSSSRLTVTWTSGDPTPVVPQTGSVTIIGLVYYYA